VQRRSAATTLNSTNQDISMGNRDRQRREEKKPKKPKPVPPGK
jgi:hypothetical protein